MCENTAHTARIVSASCISRAVVQSYIPHESIFMNRDDLFPIFLSSNPVYPKRAYESR